MAAGAKAQEDIYSSSGLDSDGVDGLLDDGDCEINAKDLGSIRHTRHIAGTV